MSSKKIDELFRSKLEGHEVVPGEQAWAKLQGKMKPASRIPAVWMQVAAAILLLLVGTWFFLTEKSKLPAAKEVAEHAASEEFLEQTPKVTPEEVPSPDVADVTPAIAREKIKDAPSAADSSKKRNEKAQADEVQVASAGQAPEKTEVPVAIKEIEKIQDQEEPQVVMPQNLQAREMETQIAAATQILPPVQEVKITYIADEETSFLEPVRELLDSDQPKEKKNGFSKLIASAKTFTKGDILAEIRESKDELFNGNLKLSKEEKVNNSK